VRIFLASSSKVALPVLDALESAGLLAGVISAPDKPVGRGRQLAPNEFANFCEQNQRMVHKPKTHVELNDVLQTQRPDLVVTIAYGKLIKAAELSLPRYGWLNIHFSQLPRWRGAAPVQHALLAGDLITGVTIFQLDQGMDTGPIYAQVEHPINSDDTTASLLDALSFKSIEPLLKSISMIEDGIVPTPQDANGVTHAPKIVKHDGRIDWNRSSGEIDRLIRAMNPWPMAWSEYAGTRTLITQARVSPTENVSGFSSGTSVSFSPLTIACGSGLLEIITVKPDGKREMSAAEWIRGLQGIEEIHFS
jgi:methionyl-tRNA formyltransferase